MSFQRTNMNGRIKLTSVKNITSYNPKTCLTLFLFETHNGSIYKCQWYLQPFCEVKCGKAHSHGFPNRAWEFRRCVVLVQHCFHSTITTPTQGSVIPLHTCLSLIWLKCQMHLANIWSSWDFISPRPSSVTTKAARLDLTAGLMNLRQWNGASEWTHSW